MSFKKGFKYEYASIRENLGVVSMSDKVHINCLRVSSAETDEHAIIKFWVCRWLRENCYEFITECKFKCGKRADVYVLNYKKGLAVEVVKTESVKSINKKKKLYPVSIECIDCVKYNCKSMVYGWCEDVFNDR